MLEATKQALELKIKSSESAETKLKSTITALQDNLSSLQSEKDSLEEELRKEILELKSQKKHLERILNDERENKQIEFEGLTESYTRQIAELEMLLKISQEKSDEKFSGMLIEKNNSIQKYEAQNEALEKKIEEISDILDDKNSEFTNLQKQIALKDRLYETSKSDFDNLEKQLSDMILDKENIEKDHKNLKMIFDSLHDSESKAQQEIISLSSQISDFKQSLQNSEIAINELSQTLDFSYKEKQELEKKLQLTEDNVSRLESDIKILEDEKSSLMQSRRSMSKRTEGEEFEKDLEFSIEEHEKKETNVTNFVVCKVVKYDNKTWCLVYVKNQNPEYNWYEKYILKDINPSLEIPIAYEDQIEHKLQLLNEEIKELSSIKVLIFPEELKCESLLGTIEMLIKNYSASKMLALKPIQASEYSEDISSIPVSGLSQDDRYSDSNKSVKVTAQEATEIFKKMKILEEENMELENRIQLLYQQLAHLKTEGRTGQYSGKSEATVEHLRGIFTSIIEKLPIQSGDIESNIKVILEILNVSKEYKDQIMEKRGEKASSEKKNPFKNFFKKKK